MMYSPNSLEIDLSDLVHNLNQLKRIVKSGTKIMGIVKADAYGHGLVPVSRVLETSAVDCLGVAHVFEAVTLRNHGIKLPLIILCGIATREEAEVIIDRNLTPVLFDLTAAELLAEEGARRGKRINVQLKVDTGMGRLGIAPDVIGPFIAEVIKYEALHLEALTSHLSSADDTDKGFTLEQIKQFKKAVEVGQAMGLDLPNTNLANSAGIMAYQESHFNMVRPGIMLYGGLPSPGFQPPLPLKPAMRFKGRILQIREFIDQTPVSYGRTYYTKGRQRIAVLSAGYGDGLPRSLSNRGKVLIRGEKVNIVGRVCMNMIMTDVTHLKEVKPGDEVVFLGHQGKDKIDGDDIARWSETISYEIFCAIGQINPRNYLS